MQRKGMMVGSGRRGYYNVIGKDPFVHSQSGKGIRQSQKMPVLMLQQRKFGQIGEVFDYEKHPRYKIYATQKGFVFGGGKIGDNILTISDFNPNVIKKMANADRAGFQWHNKNKTGGNFGYNIIFTDPTNPNNREAYMFSGDYDTEGKIRNLRLSKGFSAGARIEPENYHRIPKILSMLRERAFQKDAFVPLGGKRDFKNWSDRMLIDDWKKSKWGSEEYNEVLDEIKRRKNEGKFSFGGKGGKTFCVKALENTEFGAKEKIYYFELGEKATKQDAKESFRRMYRENPEEIISIQEETKLRKGGKVPFSKKGIEVYELPIENAVYVPSTDKNQVQVSDKRFAKRIKETEDYLSKLYGGFSRVEQIGGFKDFDTNKIIREKGARVVSFSTKADAKDMEKTRQLKNFILRKQKQWGQQAIGYEREGDLFYINRRK